MIKWTAGVLCGILLPLGGAEVTQELFVRLAAGITSGVKAGARFEGVVTGCVRADCTALLPVGSTIQGFVREVRAVGVGLQRERASLSLEFDGCRTPDGASMACGTSLVGIDNARETVSGRNRVTGIMAANHPHAYLGGLWMRPTSALIPRSLCGLTGAGRMIQSGITPHPAMAGAVILARLLFLRLPEPEIDLPAGTELIVAVTAEAVEPPVEVSAAGLGDVLAAWLVAAPTEVLMPDRSPAADLINFVVRGKREEVEQAFLGAGWLPADAMNGRTYARSYRAFTSLAPYPTAPVSPLRYQGELPDMVFQKSLNSMSKRHHIRLWEVETPEGTMWLGAATHDIGIVFDWKRLSLTHRIDREIDRERDKVLSDLKFAGCVSQAGRLERPSLERDTARVATDGAMYVVEAQRCQRAVSPVRVAEKRKVSLGKAMLRRTILESRHYLQRGNCYYWAYRGLRTQFAAGLLAGVKTTATRFR